MKSPMCFSIFQKMSLSTAYLNYVIIVNMKIMEISEKPREQEKIKMQYTI